MEAIKFEIELGQVEVKSQVVTPNDLGSLYLSMYCRPGIPH